MPGFQFVPEDRAIRAPEQQVDAPARQRALNRVESPVGAKPVIGDVRPDEASEQKQRSTLVMVKPMSHE
jgi:hypothetical protein